MMEPQRLLLCSDLDRTLLPNGAQPESRGVRNCLASFSELPGVMLAYVTGRHLELVELAISHYQLPMPSYIISDVGTRIYGNPGGRWVELEEWAAQIDLDWHGHSHPQLRELLRDIPQLELQESNKQNRHKLSFYVPLHTNHHDLLARAERCLIDEGVHASLVWSVDELKQVGLLDVLPRNATKLHAVRFLQQQLAYGEDEVLFCGDSGNDLEVMASAIPSILVANASPEVKEMAKLQAAAAGHEDSLYIAGGAMGLNGNYSAGVLEGICHYRPDYIEVITQLIETERGVA